MTYIGKVSLVDGTSLDQNGKLSAKVWKGWGENLVEELFEVSIDAVETDGVFQLKARIYFL